MAAVTPVNEDVRSVIEALEEPVLIVREGKLVAGNEPARQLFGKFQAGADVRLVIRHPQMLDLIAPGKSGQVEVSGIGDFDRKWLVSVSPLPNNSVMVRLADQSAAQAAEAMRVDFVANASHELRTPLATILGYAETLAGEEPVDDDLRIRFGQIVQSEARRMLRIVEDLMSLSRIVAEKFVPPAMEANLADIVAKATSNLSAAFDFASFEVEVDVPRDLPSVRGDFAQLEQVAENLIANALRYSGAGSQITILGRRSGSNLELIVADNGVGIARQHLPRLTERFYRVDPARSRESGGTGLGLAIVKHIVERHKGMLHIASDLGAGTTVTVSLPIAGERP